MRSIRDFYVRAGNGIFAMRGGEGNFWSLSIKRVLDEKWFSGE
jgi:hypothetical protein